MALTYPIPTVTAGEYIDTPDWNALADSINFLANPPACRVYHSATQTASTSTRTALVFNSERYDTDGMHSTSVSTDRITFNTAGLYVVTAHIEWASNAAGAGIRQVEIRANGTDAQMLAIEQNQGQVSVVQEQSVATVMKFAAGEYVQLTVFQNSGSTYTIASSGRYTPEFSATWVGLG